MLEYRDVLTANEVNKLVNDDVSSKQDDVQAFNWKTKITPTDKQPDTFM